jgi:hypothetical protein
LIEATMLCGAGPGDSPRVCAAVIYVDLDESSAPVACEYVFPLEAGVSADQAQYRALHEGLLSALELGVYRLRVRSPSALLVGQVLGEREVVDQNLRGIHARTLAVAEWFDSLSIDVEHGDVSRADELCREALGDRNRHQLV